MNRSIHIYRRVILFFTCVFLLFQGIYYGIYLVRAEDTALIQLERTLEIVADTVQPRLLTNNIYREDTLAQLALYGIIDIHLLEKGTGTSNISMDDTYITYYNQNIEMILTKEWLEELTANYIREQIILCIQQSLAMLPLLLIMLLCFIARPLHRTYVKILAALEDPSLTRSEKNVPSFLRIFFEALKDITGSWEDKEKVLTRATRHIHAHISELTSVFHQFRLGSQRIKALNKSTKELAEQVIHILHFCHKYYDVLLESAEEFHTYLNTQDTQIDRLLETTENAHTTFLHVEDTLNKYQYHTEEFSNSLQRIMKKTHSLAESMNHIYTSTDNANETIGIIKSTANQMNILAMNATIEAAHLGKSHQGLSLVANEIQNLAKIIFQNTNTLFDASQKDKEIIYSANKEYTILKDLCQTIFELAEKSHPQIRDAFQHIEKGHFSSQAYQYAKDIQTGFNEQIKSLQEIKETIDAAKKFQKDILDPESALKQGPRLLDKEIFLMDGQYEAMDRQCIDIKRLADYFHQIISTDQVSDSGNSSSQSPVNEQVSYAKNHSQHAKPDERNTSVDQPSHNGSVET